MLQSASPGPLHRPSESLKMIQRAALATVLLCPAAASAHYVADEFILGSTQATATNPRSGFLSDRLIGLADLRADLSLRLDATYTRDSPTPPAQGARFGTAAANI